MMGAKREPVTSGLMLRQLPGAKKKPSAIGGRMPEYVRRSPILLIFWNQMTMARRPHLSALLFTLSLLADAVPTLAADPVNLTVVGSVKGADGPWDYASVDAELHRLYVARGGGVMAVNLLDGSVIPTLVPGNRVHGVIPLPGGLAISTNGEGSNATLFKAADGAVLAEFPAGKKPDAVVRDAESGLVAVMNGNDGTVTLIDIDRKIVAGSLMVGGKLEFAVADGHGRVFVNVEDKNELVELDIPARKVVQHLALPQCDHPTGLALDNTTRVLVAACGNGVAIAVSAKDGKVLATLPIGKGPDAVIFDEKGRRFLVPCGRDGVLTVIDEFADGSLKVVGSVATAKGARTGAIDSSSGKVYLPTADFPAVTAGERPAAIRGSFRILVLGRG